MGFVVHCFQSEAEIAKMMFVAHQNYTVDYWDETRPSVRDSNSSYMGFSILISSKCMKTDVFHPNVNIFPGINEFIVLQLVDDLDT